MAVQSNLRDMSLSSVPRTASSILPTRKEDARMAISFLLPPEVADRIESILAQLRYKTQASCILLADIGGQLIGEQGTMDHFDTAIFSALTAGNMAATAEIARQVGEETHFKQVFHEGERQSVYLCSVGDSFLLVVVFSTRVQIGLVRLFARQAVKQLLPLAGEFEALQAQPGEAIDVDFGEALGIEMESVLSGWAAP